MFTNKKVIDLSLELYDGFDSWMIHPKVVLMDHHMSWLNKDRCKGDCEGFSTKIMVMSDHTGTHIDAQRHFFDEGDTIEKYPPNKMMGTAILLDLSFRNIKDPIDVKHLEKALEETDSSIQEDDILVMKAWPYEREHEDFPISPGLTPEAVKWILEKKIKMFATDLATVDHQDMHRSAHVNFLKNNILIIENLVNLNEIKQARFDFMGVPLKLKGATGSPIRALAFV